MEEVRLVDVVFHLSDLRIVGTVVVADPLISSPHSECDGGEVMFRNIICKTPPTHGKPKHNIRMPKGSAPEGKCTVCREVVKLTDTLLEQIEERAASWVHLSEVREAEESEPDTADPAQ